MDDAWPKISKSSWDAAPGHGSQALALSYYQCHSSERAEVHTNQKLLNRDILSTSLYHEISKTQHVTSGGATLPRELYPHAPQTSSPKDAHTRAGCAAPACSPGMVQALHHLAKGAFAQVPHDLICEREEAGRESLEGGSLAAPASSQHSNPQKQQRFLLTATLLKTEVASVCVIQAITGGPTKAPRALEAPPRRRGLI